jgi:hypothetical protein
MNIIYPKIRYDWDLVKFHFDKYFKIDITKQEWEAWKNDNINII